MAGELGEEITAVVGVRGFPTDLNGLDGLGGAGAGQCAGLETATTRTAPGARHARHGDPFAVLGPHTAADGRLWLRLNWNKRYITLAAVATVLGLAFQLHDPEKDRKSVV